MKEALKSCSRKHQWKGSLPCPLCWPGFRKYSIKAKLWIYPGEAGWHFVSLPLKESTLISERFSEIKRGWGSLRVRVSIGETIWETSIFPDKKNGSYLLPIKKEVRKKEKLEEGKSVSFSLEIVT